MPITESVAIFNDTQACVSVREARITGTIRARLSFCMEPFSASAWGSRRNGKLFQWRARHGSFPCRHRSGGLGQDGMDPTVGDVSVPAKLAAFFWPDALEVL